MKDENERLSALLDGEIEVPADSTLNDLLADVNMQYRVRRYQLIGEALRRDLPEKVDLDFHHRVMSEINKEPKPQVVEAGNASLSLIDWISGFALKPLAGMAVAAAVAVVTVSLWGPQVGQPGSQPDSIASADTQKVQQYSQQQIAPVLPASTNATGNGMQWQVDRGSIDLQNKLNGYLLNHNEYSNSVQGFIPQARVAGFDAE